MKKLDSTMPGLVRWTLRALVALGLVAWATAAPSLIEVGRWAGLGPAAYGVPVVLDGGLVMLFLGGLVQRSRNERSALMNWSAGGLVTLSVLAQVAHTMTTASVTGAALIVAVMLAGCLPLVVWVAVEAAARVLIAAPVSKTHRVAVSAAPAPAIAAPVTVDSKRPVATRDVTSEPAHEGGPSCEATRTRSRVREANPTRTSKLEKSGAEPTKRAATTSSRSAVDRNAVLALASEGLSQRAIAERLGTSKSTVARALAA